MGDHADYAAQAYLDYLEGDRLDDDEHYWPTQTEVGRTCRACGRAGLTWAMRSDKWRLHDRRGMHVCKVVPLKEPL